MGLHFARITKEQRYLLSYPVIRCPQSIAEVASKFPELQVITHAAAASISQLSAAGAKALKRSYMQGLIAGIGPDMYSGGLLISYQGTLADVAVRPSAED